MASSRASIALLAVLVIWPGAAAELVTSEETRLAGLRAIFPGMAIARVEGSRIDKSWRPGLPKTVMGFEDGLREEDVYRVTGPAVNEAERCASENMQTNQFSTVRMVRLRMYRWPGGGIHAAVVQYGFEGALPAGSCWAIAMVVGISRQGAGFRVERRRLLDMMHHTSIQQVGAADVTGDGIAELVVESDSGGASTVGSDLHVFDARGGRMTELVSVWSRLWASGDEQEVSEQILDVASTRRTRGREFCFDQRVHQEEGRWLEPARVGKRCYPAGTGVQESLANDNFLRPLR